MTEKERKQQIKIYEDIEEVKRKEKNEKDTIKRIIANLCRGMRERCKTGKGHMKLLGCNMKFLGCSTVIEKVEKGINFLLFFM